MPVIVMVVMPTVPVVPVVAAVLRTIASIRHPIADTISTVTESILQPILAIANVGACRAIADAGTIACARTITQSR
jgi:hypothetical protein